jgi:hypothetical protein
MYIKSFISSHYLMLIQKQTLIGQPKARIHFIIQVLNALNEFRAFLLQTA